MKRLTIHQVLLLHSELVHETGGEDGLRDEGLLDAALNAPFASFVGLMFIHQSNKKLHVFVLDS